MPAGGWWEWWSGPTGAGGDTAPSAVRSDRALSTTDHEPSQAERFCCIEVRDRGLGIPEQVRSRMHHFFFTTAMVPPATYGYSKTHGSAFSGLGVGVPMTMMTVEWMEGTISWKHGHGTAVCIRLPLDGFSLKG